MYVELNCHVKDRVEQFLVCGFQSLAVAVHAMKLAAKSALPLHHGVSLFHKTMELLGDKGQVQQRYTVEKGVRNEKGSFVKAVDWDMEQTIIAASEHVNTASRKSVLRLPTDDELEKPTPQLAQLFLSQAKYQVQAPAMATTPTPTSTPALRPTRQRAQAQQADIQEEVYCVCRLPDDGNFIVACGNDRCPIKWYHGQCVKMEESYVTDGQWYCGLCTRE